MNKKPVYKTWIRINRIIIFLLISISLVLIAVLPINSFIRIIAGIMSIPLLYTTFMIVYSYYQFSTFGGDFQSKIHNLIVERIKTTENGTILDIGTGSGALIIKLAKTFVKGSFVGIDYWGNDWEYSKDICERNAKYEGVSERIKFIKGSASKLPFNDEEFNGIVSCLTFHEVKDEVDKIKVVKEALRVLKKGGEFVFLDLFHDEKIFGDNNKFFNDISSLELEKVMFEKIENVIELPYGLLNKKVLGNGVIISGRK
ncbi:MAG: class I SAM-dependent methyltransferase [Clostridium sp.]|uniref:class I SAM-dependent methyltransferase n=1 Tax=Clostridium sp. TaxID=1506 RepID=UPI003F3B9B70